MKKILLLLLVLALAQPAVFAQMKHKAKKHVVHHKKHVITKHHHVTAHKKSTKPLNDDHAAYEGKDSRSNDGVKKNKQRNMNYQSNQQLPPSGGNNSK